MEIQRVQRENKRMQRKVKLNLCKVDMHHNLPNHRMIRNFTSSLIFHGSGGFSYLQTIKEI